MRTPYAGFGIYICAGALAACAGATPTSGFDSPDASTTSGGGSSPDAEAPPIGNSAEAGSFGDLIDAAKPVFDAGPPEPPKVLLYAHTNTTLYQLDPKSIASPPTSLGDFDCIGTASGSATSMTDIAVQKDGKIYGISSVAAYPLTLANGSVHCDAVWPLPTGSSFYGLTFAPENTVAPQEVLIAANSAGQLFQIDPQTGHTTAVGTFGTDTATQLPWALSGDVVFLANGGNPIGFATVRTCKTGTGGCSTTDTLIEIDVKAIKPGAQSVLKAVRGPVKTGSWCTNPKSPAGFDTIYGVAAYGDKVYGFTHSGGEILEMHNDDATACLISADTAKKYAGAGVTTIAPVQAPPPPPPPPPPPH